MRRASLLLTLLWLPLRGSSTEVLSFVQKSCTACHNGAVKSGDIDLSGLRDANTFDHDREVWEKVVEKLKTGQMPPPGVPRPPSATTIAITKWLESEFARQDRAVRPDAGRVTARRLNRAECWLGGRRGNFRKG